MPEKKNNQSGRINTATITFNGAANYGARLQTYALQKTLEHLRFQKDVLDFDGKMHRPSKYNINLQPIDDPGEVEEDINLKENEKMNLDMLF